MATVLIKNGSYRNQEIVNQLFPLIKQYQPGAKGGFVTVDGTDVFGPDYSKIRVKVDGIHSYVFVDGGPEAVKTSDATPAVVAVEPETDEQIMKRIGSRFDILNEMTKAAIAGDVRAMIVTGPPGVGKSFIVEQEVDKSSVFDKIAGRKIRSEVIKGSATALGLYCALYKYSDPGCVLVFDDSDGLFYDDTSLNLLKGALDTGKKRRISWLADSNQLRRDDIPESFDFKGTVIFITNINFENVKSKTLKDHLAALESRCHYVDLTINTMREKLLRIRQVAMESDLFADYNFSVTEQTEIIDFISDNHNAMREISLRTAIKVADLRKTFPERWKEIAATTCMKTAM